MSTTAISEHAFLSDCRSAALVTRDGSVDWLCLPRFDSPSVLGRLLDEGAGHLLLRPIDPLAQPVRRYLPQTLVLETTWTGPAGVLVVTDTLALGEDERGHDLGLGSPGVLLRSATCTDGEVAVHLVWAPRPEYGLVHPHLQRLDGAVLTSGGATSLLLSLDGPSGPVRLEGSTVTAEVVLRAGESLGVALEQVDAWTAPPPARSREEVATRLGATTEAWRSWSGLHQRYDGPLRELVHRSGLVLQGLTYARTGAVVAAATTSLPEGVGSSRTWDYRYTWVRDASMTLRGLWVAACPDEAGRFFAFLARAAGTRLERGLDLQIMFGIDAERDLTESVLPHLTGWRDSAPVRRGNGAWSQHQQDVYGALLDAAAVLADQVGPFEPATRDLLVAAVDAAATTWQVPDQGIWEVRGPARRYLHSALMCWVALDRGLAMLDHLGAHHRAPAWRQAREQVREAVLVQGWNEEVGSFTQTLSGTELDASVLLVALVGVLPPDDPRLARTVDAVEAGLSDSHGLVYRYRGEDGLEGDEGTFLLCTFWLAEALAVTGQPDRAEVVLRRAASYANDLGLLAEQVDADTGELLGNYPQAFSHLGLVLAAQALARSRERAGDRLTRR